MSDLISRQAAIETAKKMYVACDTNSIDDYEMLMEEALNVLPSAEPKRGKWIKKHRHYGGFRNYTGFDVMGEQHTVTVDERTEYDDLYCSECGARSADNFLNFCPKCGADMRGERNDTKRSNNATGRIERTSDDACYIQTFDSKGY